MLHDTRIEDCKPFVLAIFQVVYSLAQHVSESPCLLFGARGRQLAVDSSDTADTVSATDNTRPHFHLVIIVDICMTLALIHVADIVTSGVPLSRTPVVAPLAAVPDTQPRDSIVIHANSNF